jgi:hypothetical protein
MSIAHRIDQDAWQVFAACPRCAVGEQARREFWDSDPAYYSAALLGPFVLAALVGLWFSRRTFER